MRRLKSHLIKTIFGVLIVFGFSGIFLNSHISISDSVYAEDGSITQTIEEGEITETECNKKSLTHIWNAAIGKCVPLSTTYSNSMGIREILNMFLKVIYLLLRPLLVVAGISLDNTMVYASVFHLDAPLWKFWNMMKNFANFTLGFMVLFAIIKNFFVTKDEKGPIDIIKKTLIAGILIQASRFLMAALVDLSTIATYAVGGLPLSVVKNTDVGQQRILHVSSKIDLDKFSNLSDAGDAFQMRYTATYIPNNKEINISPCRIEGDYIIGRELGDPKFKHPEIFNDEYSSNPNLSGYEVCVAFNNQLVVRNENQLMNGIKTVGDFATYNPDNIKDFDSHVRYQGYMTNLINISGRENLSIVKEFAVNITSGQNTIGFTRGTTFYNNTTSLTISELVNKSKGFVGPLVTMYSSLFNFANLTDTQTTTLGQTSGIFLIKSGVAIALFFPLLALAVVLVARIALLRLYIAASPFLVLKKVFDDVIPKDLLGKLGEHLELGNVLKLVFAPVITVAALSISLIFMSALIKGFKPEENQHISANVAQNLQIYPIKTNNNNQAYKINGNTIEFENFDRGGNLDRFSRLVVNFFAIGILRTILFAAIKANALGAKIGAGIQSFGANVFQTMPILPIGEGGKRVGLGTASSELLQVPQRRVERREQAQREAILARFAGETPGGTAPTITSAQATTITGNIGQEKTVEEAITGAGIAIPKTGITALNTQENISAMYTAIESITNTQEQQTVITKLESIFGEGWFNKETTARNAAKFSKTIADQITPTNKNPDTIKKLLNDNEAISKAYFANNKEFTKDLDDGTTITITPTKDTNGTITDYTIAESRTT